MADYYVIGVSHIDMAFVMREEAQAEMIEVILERMVGVLERHPQIHFAIEQASHYKGLKERRPDLFEKVKELLANGRMEFMGGMATTAETNFPNGECFVRNQGMGLRWVEENLGVKPHAAWLIDTFGMNAQLPQIMNQFGLKHVYANRFGGKLRNDLFQAEGLDGSRVTVIGKDSGSHNVLAETQAFIYCTSWGHVDALFQCADELRSELPKLVTYYIENEGLFSEYYLELVKERQDRGEDWKHATYREYSEALEASGYEAPVEFGDLNPEFTGTFALRTPIKVENRKSETLLMGAEMWSALTGSDDSELEECWWKMFFNQFHDVFTGSHEDITYKNVLNKFASVQETSLETWKKALQIRESDHSVTCCNSLPWERTEWVELCCSKENLEVYDQEEKVPVIKAGDKWYFKAQVAAGAVKTYTVKEGTAVSSLTAENTKEISNEFLHLVLSERNGIEKLEDVNGNCYLSKAADFLTLEEDKGNLQIENCEGKEIFAASGEVHIGEAISDEMGQRITMSGKFPQVNWWKGSNELSWSVEFSLRRGEKGLRTRVTVDWKGEGARIRFKVPGTLDGRDVYHEIPYGVVRRAPYQNLATAKGEWPVHRFAVLEDGTKGIALINRGVAGVEQEGKTLATTLIRAYGQGWIRPSAISTQHGEQTFDFMIVPYEGGFGEAGIYKIAQEFNQPIVAFDGCSDLSNGESRFGLEGDGLVLSAIKKAWDGSGDLIVRIYETLGKKSGGELRIRGMQSVWSSDMPETKGEQLAHQNDTLIVEFAPFEIKTFRISIK